MEKMLVIFDCDGVLVDSEGLAAQALASSIMDIGYDITPEETQEMFLGYSLDMVINSLKTDLNLTVGDTFKSRYLTELHSHMYKNLTPIPEIHQTISRVKHIDRVKNICVASNGELETVRISLQITSLISFFGNNIFTVNDVLYGKPNPDLFLYTAEQMRFAPSQCIVVEDSLLGVKAAIAAGMSVFGYIEEQRSIKENLHSFCSAGAKTFVKMNQLPLLIENMQPTPKLKKRPGP